MQSCTANILVYTKICALAECNLFQPGNLSYLLRCQFSPVFIGLIVEFHKILWRLNPSLDHLLAYLWLPLKMMTSPDETESCQVIFMVMLQSVSWIVTLFHLSFFSSSSPESELSGFSGSLVLLATNLLTLCQFIDLLHLIFRVFMQLGAHRSKGPLQDFCQIMEHCLIAFDDILSCERIRDGTIWVAMGGNSPFPWILSLGHDWCGSCRQNFYLSWAAVKDFLLFHWKSCKEDFLEFGQNSSAMSTQ